MKQLILIRHGKPEPTGTGKPDALRELTPAGRAALAAPTGFETTFTELLADAEGAGLDLAPEGQAIALWTSPAVRAHQTADEARGALERLGRGVSAPVEHTSLWEQDDAAFLAELVQAQATSIVACGHIPFMNRICTWLTGEEVAFTPGAAALIVLPDEVAEGAAALISFIDGPAV